MMMIIESTADFKGVVEDLTEEEQVQFDAVKLADILPVPGSQEVDGLRIFLCTADESANDVFNALDLPIGVLAQQNQPISEINYATICEYMLPTPITDESGEVTGTEPFSGALPVFAGAEWLL